MTQPEQIKSKCNICHNRTIHNVLFLKKETGSEEIAEDFFIDWWENWRVIQCRGCESISMMLDAWNSELTDGRGHPQVKTTYFPPRIFRKSPAWLHNDTLNDALPIEIKRLLNELYIALQNDCNAASTMLMRAIFEHTMINKIGDQGSFAEHLKKLHEEGFIGSKQKDVVASMLEAGHATIHRSFIPQKSDLITLVDILESVLQVVYIQAPQADDLKNRIPKKNDANK